MKRKKKTKRQKPLLIKIGAGIGLVILAVGFWSWWWGRNNPQTGFQRLRSIMKQSIFAKKTTAEIIFLGDSITARQDWDSLLEANNIMNAGISGNTTEDVLARMDSLMRMKPKKVFVMIGTNDLAKGKTVSEVLDNYQTIIQKIKIGSPQTVIYIESLLPVDNEFSPIGKIDSQEIVKLNSDLKMLAEQENLTFINLYPHFLDQNNAMDSQYASDGVHPNAKGYALMKKLLSPYVK